MRRRAGLLAAVALLLWLGPAGPARAQAPARATTTSGDVVVVADRLEEIGPKNLVIATGHVEVTRGTMRILADRMQMDRETGDSVAEGHVILYDGEDRLTGPRVEYNFRTGTGVVHQGTARTAPYYRVAGARMEKVEARRYHVEQGVFTTCPDDPAPWTIRFGEADATLDESVWGRNASFWVRDVPVLWTPLFGAPLGRERQTGFLPPVLGQSSRKGYFAEIPFFWAISDSQDATVTLETFSARGVGAEGEYRYVLSENQRGSARAFYVNEMFRDVPDPTHGDNRAWWDVKHRWLIAPRATLTADIKGVSDDLVFREYADRLQDRRIQRAESNVFLTRGWQDWNVVGNLFWYQDLTTTRPTELQRLPDLRVQGTRQPLPGVPGLLYEVEARGVNFVRDEGSQGLRGDLHARLSRPIPLDRYLTVTPFVGGRLTGYDKTATGLRVATGDVIVDVTRDDPRLRSLAELGADVETQVSRVYTPGGVGGIDALLHSIEPRLNYTWIDGRHLDRLPNYESTVDGIRPTSLVTYSLVNRVRARAGDLDDAGARRWELARFTISQTYDLEKSAHPFGDLVSELIVSPAPALAFRGATGVDVYGDGLRTATADVSVNLPARLTATLGTRYERQTGAPSTNFLHGAVRAELLRSLVVTAETNWDLRTDTFVENRIGTEFRFDCWAVSLAYVTRNKDEKMFHVSVSLLGLGRTGFK